MTSIVPHFVSRWIRQNYPKPEVNPDWLNACLSWIADELGLTDTHAQGDDIIKNVENQLLNSDLRDSMREGTGLPKDIAYKEDYRLYGKYLVQITSITEIGHSAFTLQNVHQTRIDRADLNGLAGENENEDLEDGPIPKFPRSMLKFEISDGTNSLRAIEFKRLPELELGITPLGYKMIIKDVPIRRGIAFLEPNNVELKGYMTEEIELYRDAQFAEDIHQRLGRPDLGPDDSQETTVTDSAVSQGTTLVNSREPLRDLDLGIPSHLGSQMSSRGREHEPFTRRRRIPSHRSSPTHTSLSLHASTATVRQPSKLSHEITEELDYSDFGDDAQLDDAFFRELDSVEQAAIAASREANTETSGVIPHDTDSDEVIAIDSDSEDKENLAPALTRRVRRRIIPPEEEEVIVID